LKTDGEDLLVAAVHRQVTIGSESVFSMLMMHGVEFDADKVTSMYPKDKDGRDIALKGYLERARNLSTQVLRKRGAVAAMCCEGGEGAFSAKL
jgi:hypothetical protein